MTREPDVSLTEAVARSLAPVLAEMTGPESERITGIPVGTLRRLAGISGTPQKSVKAHLIERLRRLPGFSAEFDRLTGQDEVSPAALRLGQRLLRAFPGTGAELVLYNLETLGEDVSAETVADLLRNAAALLAAKRPTRPEPRKMPLSAESGRK